MAETWAQYRKDELAARLAWLQAKLDLHGHIRETARQIDMAPAVLSRTVKDYGLKAQMVRRGRRIPAMLTEKEQAEYRTLRQTGRLPMREALTSIGRADLIPLIDGAAHAEAK